MHPRSDAAPSCPGGLDYVGGAGIAELQIRHFVEALDEKS
jgi:hypothetical protein